MTGSSEFAQRNLPAHRTGGGEELLVPLKTTQLEIEYVW